MTVSVSRRGMAEPFHAMDVLAEANRLIAAGQHVISLAVGPAVRSRAADRARGGARARLPTAASAIRTRSAFRPCARRSPRTTATTMA